MSITSCIEQGKAARLEAYPLSASKFTTPVYAQSLTAPSSLLPSRQAAEGSTSPIFPIHFVRDTLKGNDKSSRSVAGVVHQVTVNWEFRPKSQADYDLLSTLQRVPHELIVTYFGMQQKLIRTDPDGYAFDFEEDNGTVKCTMTLTNGQGVTAIL